MTTTNTQPMFEVVAKLDAFFFQLPGDEDIRVVIGRDAGIEKTSRGTFQVVTRKDGLDEWIPVEALRDEAPHAA